MSSDADADPYLAGLSAEQRQVVLAPPGPLLVLAGAGSGKTRALTHRVGYFLHHGVAAERVLLVTFTNQAARQMVARLTALSPRRLEGLWAGTFHHLAMRVLRRHGYRIGLSDRFLVLDRADANDLLGSCLSERPPPPGTCWPRAAQLQSLLSLSVNAELALEQVLAQYAPELVELSTPLAELCDRYALRKLQLGLCDFDDLLLGWRLLLCDHRAVRDEQRQQFQHLFIDEYQDTSRIQSAICEDLAQGYRSITVVGDDAQSIYRFRGAVLANLHEFRGRWPDAQLLYLSNNYRSSPSIITLSNRSIAHNSPVAGLPRAAMQPAALGPPRSTLLPALVALPDPRLQAAFVVQRIREQLGRGRSPADIAILYRSHRQARELQVELLRCQLPFTLRSGPRVSEGVHMQDALAFLRLAHNPHDRLAWSRVLRQVAGLGDTGRGRILGALDEQRLRGASLPDLDDKLLSHARAGSRRALHRLFSLLAELRELSRAHQSLGSTATAAELPAKLLALLLDRHYRDYARRVFVDAEQRLGDLEALCQSGAATGTNRQTLLPLSAADALRDFLCSGLGSDDQAPAPPEAIVLSTIHQAKGLEWGLVFVVWLADGHFPAKSALDERHGSPLAAEEEERRLFYVAVTRTRDELYLCYPCAAATHGALRRSRFLDELDGPAGTVPYERWAVLTQSAASRGFCHVDPAPAPQV